MSGKYQRRITNTVRRHRLDYMLLQYKVKSNQKCICHSKKAYFPYLNGRLLTNKRSVSLFNSNCVIKSV